MTKSYKNGEFADSMKKFIQRVYPDEYSPELVDLDLCRINHFEEMFLWLDEIYDNRDRYNLHWALHEAGDIFKRLMDEAGTNISQSLRKHYTQEERERLNELTSKMDWVAREKELAIARRTEYFNTISNLLTRVDIIISVALIVIISEISHLGNTIFGSVILVIIFTGIVAFLKVTFDRFIIIPWIARLGWKKYLNEVEVTRKILVDVEAVNVVVIAAIKDEKAPEVTYKLIERGTREISMISDHIFFPE
ncbi:hypothetical protein [Methanoplanus endosymbiosus]|uniref:Uncharacterized protein n=1 Tax=Methanoplanus endosymbiosus TaxID=33865 RepID=A0A9E7PT37_9EURY|nr:hypothetical protein [Methanoplanus endosymbiosus]UUX93352.1 hypothetical protein L6E24_04285 [Methanoplanus endosymbiosus]